MPVIKASHVKLIHQLLIKPDTQVDAGAHRPGGIQFMADIGQQFGASLSVSIIPKIEMVHLAIIQNTADTPLGS